MQRIKLDLRPVEVQSEDGLTVSKNMNLKGNLIVLTDRASLFNNIKSHLQFQGWYVEVFTSLKPALEMVLKNRPDFFLISSKYPDSRVHALPAVLASAHSIPVAFFSESLKPRGDDFLTNHSWKYKIMPPMTGPNFERSLLKLQKLEQAQLEIFNKNVKNLIYKPKAKDFLRELGSLPGEAWPENKKLSLPVDLKLQIYEVKNVNWSGYFLWTHNQEDSLQDLNFDIQIKLRDRFPSISKLNDNGGGSEIKIWDVDANSPHFLDWAEKCALGVQKKVFRGEPTVYAFIEKKLNEKPEARILDQAFTSIFLEDIDMQKAFPFDLYLFFPSNSKFLQFHHKGAAVHPAQIKKWSEKGILEVYIHRKAWDEFRLYRAALFVQKQLAEFPIPAET